MSERAKIRRGTQPRRRRAVVTPRRPSVAPRVKTGAVRALATIPLPMAQIRRWSWRALWLLAVVAGGVLLLALHVPATVGTAFGEAAGDLGLSVRHVEITGTHHLDQLAVDSIAFDQRTTAMPLIDLGEIRSKLLRFGWVQDARVSRRLPDTLVVDIVERKPAAIWQYHGKLSLIDANGTLLAPVDLAHMPDLPIVIGPDANRQATSLAALLDAAPALKPMLAGASWIGGRRWDLRFQSGETLALPEGDDAARAAIAKFERMDQATPLLGRNYSHFDMRIEGKFYARVKGDPGDQVGAPDPAKSAADAT